MNPIRALAKSYHLSLITLLYVGGSVAVAEPFDRNYTTSNPSPAIADDFGRNLAITPTGDILTGSQLDDDPVLDAGFGYLLDGVTGQVKFRIPNPEPQPEDRFGAFVAAGANQLIVSAFWKDDGLTTDTGRVYLFDPLTGQLNRTIVNPAPVSDDQFGYGIAGQGDSVVVGCKGFDGAGSSDGIAYVFSGLTGALTRTIFHPAPTTEDNFGYSVAAIGTDKILIGAPGNDVGAMDAGAAYLFNANTGALLHTLQNPDPVVAAFFGFQVRPRGDDLLVGAPFGGGAYLFDGVTGQLIHRLSNPNPQPGSAFGCCIAAVGDDVLVGDPFAAGVSVPTAGRAYLFDGASGGLVKTIENPTPDEQERFGISVAGRGLDLVIGCDQDDIGTVPFAGSVSVFQGRFAPTSADAEWLLYE